VTQRVGDGLRNALVLLNQAKKTEAPAAPCTPATEETLDAMTYTPLRLTQNGLPMGIPSLVSAAMTITKEAALEMHPTQILKAIESGEMEVTVPGIPGTYGHGITKFEVEENTTMTLKVKVEGGRIIPEMSKLVFEPKLDNVLWIRTAGATVEQTRPGYAKIELDLALFPDINLTKRLFDMRELPTAMKELIDLAPKLAAKVAENTSEGDIGTPFDGAKFELDIKNARFTASAIPIGGGGTLVLAPNNVLGVSGNKDGLTIAGNVHFSEAELDAGTSFINVSDVHSNGSVFLSYKDDLSVKDVRVDLHNVRGSIDAARLEDGKGSNATLGRTTFDSARISLAVQGDDKELSVQLPNLSTLLTDARLQAGEAAITIGSAKFDGGFALFDDVLSISAKSANLTASAEKITLGQGPVRLSYGQLDVTGKGALDFDGETATMKGLLNVDGVIDDAHIGQDGSPLSISITAGSQIALSVDEAIFGKSGGSFKGSGEFTAGVDRGSVMLPNGEQLILLPGSSAKVEAKKIDIDKNGLAAEARVTVTGAADTKDSGARTQVVLDDVSITKDGVFKIGAASAEATASINGIKGKLRSKPTLVTETKGPNGLRLTPPTPEAMLDNVASCDLDAAMDVKAGRFGVWPVRCEVKEGTKGQFTAKVKDGLIDFASVRLDFSPPLEGPLWIDGNGIKVDKRGHFIADLKGLPNLDLSLLMFNQVVMPKTLKELPAMLDKITSFLNSRLGRLLPFPALPALDFENPIDTLARTGTEIHAKDVALKSERVVIGADSYIKPTDTSRFTLDADGKGLTLKGKAGIADARVSDESMYVTGLKGEADLSLTVVSHDREHRVLASLDNVSGETNTIMLSGDNGSPLTLKGTRIDNAKFGFGATVEGTTTRFDISQIGGNASVDVALDAGTLVLDNGAKLEVDSPTNAKLQVTRVSRKEGDAFTEVEGTLSFEASLSGALPEAGLKNDFAQINQMGENNGRVTVRIGLVKIASDGSFNLDAMALSASARASAIVGRINQPRLEVEDDTLRSA
jgi:hypothetical protein